MNNRENYIIFVLLHAVACKNSNFLCDNGKCIDWIFTCNRVDNCGDNSDEASCGIETAGADNSFFSKFFGGFFGGAAGVTFLIIAVIVITIVICVYNKKCPLYKRRHRQQPPVGIINVAEPDHIPVDIEDNTSLIKEDELDDSSIRKGKQFIG